MCGIFGAVFLRGESEAVDVDAALKSIRHRGPDRADVYRTPLAVFGHTRLSVLDLSDAAAQPMRSADGLVTLVYNGEIYNHHALRAELIALGHTFRTRSDTEVILEGYRAWGERVVERLDGMFAIGLFDAESKRLLLARDRPGKKPLFYTLDRGEVRFASEIKALVASGWVPEVNVAALPALLSFGYVPPPRSMFRGVLQLPPATLLIMDEGHEPRIRRYWRAPFRERALESSLEDATREVRRLVEQAVERRLEADVPLGAFLSGGVDSSIVVGVMARKMGRRVRTFSIGFAGDARYDETHYARLVSKKFDTDHTEFVVEPSSFDLVERLVAVHDGPFGDSSAIPTSIVSMLTRKHVTVTLTGDGGDELFCGYPRFLAAEAAEAVPSVVRRVGGGLSRALPAGLGERTLTARARRFLRAASLPLADRILRWQSYFAFDLDTILRPEIRRDVPVDEPRAWNRAIFEENGTASTLARVLDYNFETYLPYDLLVKADRSTMLHGLEARSPFLDTELVEYAARLPDGFKRRGTNMKWILKRAFEDILPPEIMTRGKMGFGMPLGTWFRTGLKDYLFDHLTSRAAVTEYLDPAAVETLVREHLAGRADNAHPIWLLLTFEVWLRSMGRRPQA
jgi:asparagine synthase (glutamine-hydrolysing)